MTLLSKKEFSKACGITTKELSVYISRGKVILQGKNIDDTLPENLEFMEHKQAKGSKKITVKVKPAMSPKEQESYELRLTEVDKQRKVNTNIKEREHEKLNEEIELLKIKRQKLEGYFIPVDIIRNLMAQEFRQFVVSFQQGADILIMEISKKKS